jgi:hypothetical protein
VLEVKVAAGAEFSGTAAAACSPGTCQGIGALESSGLGSCIGCGSGAGSGVGAAGPVCNQLGPLPSAATVGSDEGGVGTGVGSGGVGAAGGVVSGIFGTSGAATVSIGFGVVGKGCVTGAGATGVSTVGVSEGRAG